MNRKRREGRKTSKRKGETKEMGTRGAYGIRKNGVDKITYNHFDSYPEGLGADFAKFCARLGKDGLSKLFDAIELVSERSKPSAEQIETCVRAGYYNSSVSNRSVEDWYCLLRNLMGNFDEYERLAETGETVYMIDSSGFLKDSLFCEYAYVANLDDEILEFWVGFQKRPQAGNRYGEKANDGYYPCRLTKTFPLDGLTLTKAKEIVAAMDNATRAEEADPETATKLAEATGMTYEDAAEAVVLLAETEKGLPEDLSEIFFWKSKEKFAREVAAAICGDDEILDFIDYEGYADELTKSGTYVVLSDGKLVGYS